MTLNLTKYLQGQHWKTAIVCVREGVEDAFLQLMINAAAESREERRPLSVVWLHDWGTQMHVVPLVHVHEQLYTCLFP